LSLPLPISLTVFTGLMDYLFHKYFTLYTTGISHTALTDFRPFSLISYVYWFSVTVCCRRSEDQSSVATAVKNAIMLHKQFPNYMAGFDLVSVEDGGHPLVYFINEFLYPSQTGVDLPYFFHAGETSQLRL